MFNLLSKKQDSVKEALIKQGIEGEMNTMQDERNAEVKRLQAVAEKMKKYMADEGIIVKDAVIVLEGLLGNLKQVMGQKFQPVLDEWNKKTLTDFYATETKPDATA